MKLRDYTNARVGLGAAGGSLPTVPLLDLRLAQARARDAVHLPLDSLSLQQESARRGWSTRLLHSAAKDRAEYLRRPDKGRQLDERSLPAERQPIAIIIADGLSALAVHRHALPLLAEALPKLELVPGDENPLWIVQQARVGIGDPIGALLGADLSIVIIGERPGLSSADSLSIYLTWQPNLSRTDADRNCISNIHGQGLSYEAAARKLVFLVNEARRRKLSGVALKETASRLLIEGVPFLSSI